MAQGIAHTFNDSIRQTVDMFCPNGTCIEQGAMALNASLNLEGAVNAFLGNQEVKGLVDGWITSAQNATGEDGLQALQALNNANSAEEAAQVAEQTAAYVQENNEEANDLFTWLGSFFGGM